MRTQKQSASPLLKPGALKNHLVICGLGHVGYRIAELLDRLGEPFTVITQDIRPEWRAWIESKAQRFVEGDARLPANLHTVGISAARAVLVVTDEDLINIEIALDIQKLNPNLPLIVRVFDRFLADRAERQMRVRSVLSPALLTAPVFVAAAQGQEMVRAFEIANLRLNVLRLRFAEGSPATGRSMEAFCSEYGLLLLSCEDAAETHSHDFSESPLKAVDSLIVMASEEATGRLRREGYLPRRPDELQPHKSLRKRLYALLTHPHYPLMALRKAWRQAPGILRGAFLTLHVLLILSVILFHEAMPNQLSWVDSFYFVVTMMTTVGFGDLSLLHAPWWLKLYGCGVMAAGAALVAIFFGIITDYIVTQRVEQALGRRTTSLKDHIVVIGLGDVGTRIVEELNRIGEPVVAIEREADHESVPALQDHIHIIIGDANRESAMQQANVAQARAVIVTTTNDMESLRIAHQAETLNPQLRSVVRIYDSTLAHKLGIGLGIDRAVNAAATAAATFVASALQTGVEQGFTLGDRLLTLRWMSSIEVRERYLVGKNAEELKQRGVMALAYRRSGERPPASPIPPSYTLSDSDELLVLEEYDPLHHAFTAPKTGC